jgi:two-component system, OmpR family, response regulator
MQSRMALGNLTIDRARYEVLVGDRRIELTYVEFELLYVLARNAGKVLSRARLLQAVWNEPAQEDDRKLTVHMSRLRKKLAASEPWQIETYTKRGYALMNRHPESPSTEHMQNGLRSANSARVLATMTEGAPMEG